MSPRVGPWLDLLRFEEYGPFFVFCALAGSVAAGEIGLGVVLLVLFVASFSASAFVVNDVVDVEEDLRKSKCRNPIAAGLISRRSGLAAFGILACVSVSALLLLTPEAILLGLLALGLYWGYSWGLNLKAIPIVDVLVHGAVPAVFVVMGAAVAGRVNYFAALIAVIVFAVASMSGLLQQVRDLDADRAARTTTAMALGVLRSAEVCTALALVGILLFACLPLMGLLPLWYLLFVPAGYFLLQPLILLGRSRIGADDAIARIRSVGLVISVALIAAYLIPV